MCLVLGPRGVGKTLLLKRLQSCSVRGNWNDLEPGPVTIPTVGTNLVNVSVGKRLDVTLREIGGSMAPIWPTYYKDCNAIIFVIDVSNRQQVSAALILLLELLDAAALEQASVLILLNKCDLPSAMSRTELQSLIRFDDVLRCARQRSVGVVQCSAKDGGGGLVEVMQWIQRNVRTSTQSS